MRIENFRLFMVVPPFIVSCFAAVCCDVSVTPLVLVRPPVFAFCEITIAEVGKQKTPQLSAGCQRILAEFFEPSGPARRFSWSEAMAFTTLTGGKEKKSF
jgi:hypothetical protein